MVASASRPAAGESVAPWRKVPQEDQAPAPFCRSYRWPEPSLVSIGEKGARFKSYYDSSIKSLTPENSIQIQRQLGADLVVVLGEPVPRLRGWSRGAPLFDFRTDGG